MSVGEKVSLNTRNHSLLGVFLVVFCLMPIAQIVPTVEASVTGDMAITDSAPIDDGLIAAYESLLFSATVENKENTNSPARIIDWNVCEGITTTNSCISNSIADGQIVISPIAKGFANFTSVDYFNPGGYNGALTIVYQFDQFDLNPSDDVYVFHLNSTNEFVDVRIDTSHDITENVMNLASFQGEDIFNSNTNYSFEMSGAANLCPSCTINVTYGWELWDFSNTSLISSNYDYYEDPPKYAYYSSISLTLPAFNHSSDGTFILKYGFFGSTGTPYPDTISENNLDWMTITIDSTVDLSIDSISPRHDFFAQNYLYGEEMLSVSISNNGNVTISDIPITLSIKDFNGNVISQSFYLITSLAPNANTNCRIDVFSQGTNLLLEVSIPTTFAEGNDITPENNIIDEISDIEVAPLSAYIVYEDISKEWYTNNEYVNISGFSNYLAAGPVNYSWWYAGFMNKGYGSQISIFTGDYDLGSHIFRFTVTDAFGNYESIYITINIYFELTWTDYPFSEATAITTGQSEIEHSSSLPVMGETYGVGGGKSPLMLLSYDLVNQSSSESLLTGSNWIDVTLYYEEILPGNIPKDSLDVRKLSSPGDLVWDLFDENHVSVDKVQDTISVRLYEGTTILLIGELQKPVIEARNFTVNLESSGGYKLTWDNYGEIDNQYLQGWSIYKKVVNPNIGTVFPSDEQSYNEIIWMDLIQDSFIETISSNSTEWFDYTKIDSELCASFAIVPIDRMGVSHYEVANVSQDEFGVGTFVCSDNTPPSTSIQDFTHEWEFTNSTECFMINNDWSMCYKVELTWTFPSNTSEENLTWNLYRIEQNPNGIDLQLSIPILSSITNNDSEVYTYVEFGIDDPNLRPKRTYYYILTPIDSVDNERTIAIYPSQNVQRVHINDDWWSYNQHLIPEPEPEEEPPLNNEWLGNFSDSMDNEEFRTAGSVALIVLSFGIILLAFITKRLRRLKKVVTARNRKILADSMANEFDEIFE